VLGVAARIIEKANAVIRDHSVIRQRKCTLFPRSRPILYSLSFANLAVKSPGCEAKFKEC